MAQLERFFIILENLNYIIGVDRVSYLNDPVLRWSASLSFKHCIDTCCHCHRDRLHPFLRHVPLLGVLVDLVMVQTTEGNVSGENDLGATLLEL